MKLQKGPGRRQEASISGRASSSHFATPSLREAAEPGKDFKRGDYTFHRPVGGAETNARQHKQGRYEVSEKNARAGNFLGVRQLQDTGSTEIAA